MTEIKLKKENVLKAFDSLRFEENLGTRSNWERTFRLMCPEAFEEEKKEPEESTLNWYIKVYGNKRSDIFARFNDGKIGVGEIDKELIIINKEFMRQVRDLAIKKVDECYVNGHNEMHKQEGIDRLGKM